jgi:hypothetical protein
LERTSAVVFRGQGRGGRGISLRSHAISLWQPSRTIPRRQPSVLESNHTLHHQARSG